MEEEKKTNTTGAALFTIGLIVFGVIIWFGITLSKNQSKSNVVSDYEIVNACEKFIENNLKAPKSAEFPPESKAVIDRIANNLFEVVSYVDAQNSFGAMIRTFYTCEVRHGYGGGWELIDLEFAE